MSVHRTLPSPKAARSLPRLLPLLAALTLAACGGGEAPPADAPAPAPAPQATAALLAGSTTENGCVDGPAAIARFGSPRGIAVDDGGNVYVADAGCNAVRKVAPDGAVSTFSGLLGTSGFVSETAGANARFHTPSGLAYHSPSRRLFVSDIGDPARIVGISVDNTFTEEITFNAGFGNKFASALSVNNKLDAVVINDSISEVRKALGGFVNNANGFRGDLTLADSNEVTHVAVLMLNASSANHLEDLRVGGSSALLRKADVQLTFSTVSRVGDLVLTGRQDGSGSDARFVGLTGVAQAPGNFAFLADTDNIRQVELTTMNVTTLVPDLGELKGTRQLAATVDGKTLYYTTARGVVKVTLP